MAAKKKVTKKRTKGRPAANIDWEKVDNFLKADCEGTEIAAHLGITPKTLYGRCITDNKVIFSEYLREKKEAGNIPIKVTQYKQALSGNISMLIWLGKQRLKQRDKFDHTTNEQTISNPQIMAYDKETQDLIKKTLDRKKNKS